jgi:hypothetical protein
MGKWNMCELDRMIMRIALRDARHFMSQGYLADEAAAMATPGAWSVYRLEIVMYLCDRPETVMMEE